MKVESIYSWLDVSVSIPYEVTVMIQLFREGSLLSAVESIKHKHNIYSI